MLGQIQDEVLVLDDYMNALTDGFGGTMSSTHVLVLLSVVLAAVVIAVLATALIQVRRGLASASENLGTLAAALEGVEERICARSSPRSSRSTPSSTRFWACFRGSPPKRAIVADRRPQ